MKKIAQLHRCDYTSRNEAKTKSPAGQTTRSRANSRRCTRETPAKTDAPNRVRKTVNLRWRYCRTGSCARFFALVHLKSNKLLANLALFQFCLLFLGTACTIFDTNSFDCFPIVSSTLFSSLCLAFLFFRNVSSLLLKHKMWACFALASSTFKFKWSTVTSVGASMTFKSRGILCAPILSLVGYLLDDPVRLVLWTIPHYLLPTHRHFPLPSTLSHNPARDQNAFFYFSLSVLFFTPRTRSS